MTHPSKEKQTPSRAVKTNDTADEPRRLPDVIMDNEPAEVFDIPRQAIPKPVHNVLKGSLRLPDVLIDD